MTDEEIMAELQEPARPDALTAEYMEPFLADRSIAAARLDACYKCDRFDEPSARCSVTLWLCPTACGSKSTVCPEGKWPVKRKRAKRG
jgi:hypothetical protein